MMMIMMIREPELAGNTVTSGIIRLRIANSHSLMKSLGLRNQFFIPNPGAAENPGK